MSDDDLLRQEHERLRKLALIQRKTAAQSEGKLAAAFRELMLLWDQQKADGVPFLERMKGLTAVLRDVWPQTRAWHYVCDDCSDTGLVTAVCRLGARCDGLSSRVDHYSQKPGKYRRLCGLNPDSDYVHEYSRPCQCVKGERFKHAPKAPADFAQAGRSSKPTRLGH